MQFFKHKAEIKPVDRITLTKQAKWQNCFDLWKQNTNITFVAWFNEAADEFNAFIQTNSTAKPEIYLATEIQFMHLQNAAFIFLEHYPLRSKEFALFEKLQLKEAIIYSSLDEPLLLHAGSENIAATMHSLGIEENEVFEHKFISAAIKNLQQKIESKMSFEKTAHSPKEWIKLNAVNTKAGL